MEELLLKSYSVNQYWPYGNALFPPHGGVEEGCDRQLSGQLVDGSKVVTLRQNEYWRNCKEWNTSINFVKNYKFVVLLLVTLQ